MLELSFGVKQIKSLPCVSSSAAFFFPLQAVKWCLMHLQLNMATRLGKHNNKGLWKCTDHNSERMSQCMRIHMFGG